MNESISPHATETPLSEERKADVSATASPEQFATTPNPGSHSAFRKPFLGSPVLWATAAILVLVGLLCLPGKRDSASGAPQPQLTEQLAEIKASFDELRDSLGDRTSGRVGNQPAERDAIRRNFAVEKARELEKAGDHEKAGYYWRNAVEHASDGELLSVLGEYAEAFFKAKTEDSEARYAEAATLERLAELALVRVPPEKMDKAFELRDKCGEFRENCFDELVKAIEEETPTNDEPEAPPEPVAKQVADEVEVILNNLAGEIDSYTPNPNPEPGKAPSESECRILQLSGVAETAMSQLWFLDRSGVEGSVTNQINAFPKRLADLIDDFNRKHDAPIVAAINNDSNDNAPDSISHQSKFVFYTNRYETASNLFRDLRGTNDQEIARKSLERIMQKATNEKREQMNRYQLFVAHCCDLAYEGMASIMSGRLSKDGEILNSWGYNDADDFIEKKANAFSKELTPNKLLNSANFEAVYYTDYEIRNAMDKSKEFGEGRINIPDKKKAFIALAVFGFYRIDQSLLTPETSRIFNDVFQKYYEKLGDDDKVKSFRWMVEMPKFKLEDF